MDETWLNEEHRLQKERVDLVTLNKANQKLPYDEGLTVGCTNTRVGKGKRLIITDAMTQNGPVDGRVFRGVISTTWKSFKILIFCFSDF